MMMLQRNIPFTQIYLERRLVKTITSVHSSNMVYFVNSQRVSPLWLHQDKCGGNSMSPWFLYCDMQIKAHANEVVTDWVGNLSYDQKALSFII